jgi:hypothetical protein
LLLLWLLRKWEVALGLDALAPFIADGHRARRCRVNRAAAAEPVPGVKGAPARTRRLTGLAGQLLSNCRFVNRDRLCRRDHPRERYISRRRKTESLRNVRITGCFSNDGELVDYGIALFLEATNTSRQGVNVTQVLK